MERSEREVLRLLTQTPEKRLDEIANTSGILAKTDGGDVANILQAIHALHSIKDKGTLAELTKEW